MGKKSSNKKKEEVAPSAPAASAAPSDWTATLDDKERELETEKMAVRQKKAEENARQAQKDVKWKEWKNQEAAKDARKKVRNDSQW
ncbi:unnamed protein product, partial [Polarella glacialis]